MSVKTKVIRSMIKSGRIRSFFTPRVRHWSSAHRVEERHFKSEARRLKEGKRRQVDYFHQSDDPYSQLTAQVLKKLKDHYDVDVVPHLVGAPDSRMIASFMMDNYIEQRRQDAVAIAPFYGLSFPPCQQPSQEVKRAADRILTRAIAEETFFDMVEDVGAALWKNDQNALEQFALSSDSACDALIARSEKRRSELGYVYGGTFHYGGEWFLGVDRINHLEARLISQGARKADKQGVVVPRPQEEGVADRRAGHVTLEFFPSLRSPYTAAAMPRIKTLVERTGAQLVARPVLPIIMREGKFDGNLKEAPTEQGIYVYMDSAREARFHGMAYGDLIDCTGSPVSNCYSLFPWAREHGKEFELLAAFTDAAFSRGVDTATDAGMKTVVENAGLDWSQAKNIMGNTDWQEEIDQNLQDMYDMGLWGVPSFRISGGGAPAIGIWGQDRIWLIEDEILKRAANEATQAK